MLCSCVYQYMPQYHLLVVKTSNWDGWINIFDHIPNFCLLYRGGASQRVTMRYPTKVDG